MEHILNYLKHHPEMCLCYKNSPHNTNNGCLYIMNIKDGNTIAHGKDIEELEKSLLYYLYQK